MLGPLGARGLRCSDSSGAACSAHQASFTTISRWRSTAAGLIKDPRGSLPVVWVTSRHGNAKRLKRPHSRARTNRTHGVTARRKCVAEVGGRRCDSEKRRRSVPLTRRSGVCVAEGLARTNCWSILHGETWGEAISDRADESTSRVGSRRQSREIDQRRRQP